MKPSVPGLFLGRRFLIIASIFLLVIGLFRFSLSQTVDLVGFMFLGICLFHVGYPVCYCVIVHSTLCRIGSEVPTFIFDFSSLSFPSFFFFSFTLYSPSYYDGSTIELQETTTVSMLTYVHPCD